MKPHTYTFQFRDSTRTLREGTVEATSKEGAYLATMADTRLAMCKILKGTFRRTDTAKGANRAAGLDSNGKQLDSRHFQNGNPLDSKSLSQWIQDKFEANAYKDFLNHLDLAIEALYNCRMENNGAVLSMPIKELYEAMKEYDPFK